MIVYAVIPAYNESRRIHKVLDVLSQAPSVAHIVVVDDGSVDGTGDVARAHPASLSGKLTVIGHKPNQGKGAAMRAGADYAREADVLLFFDADLIGLTVEHVEKILTPFHDEKMAMALGVFAGGRFATTIAQKLSPNISGQRAIRRDVFLSIPCLSEAGYGVELAITNFVLGEGLPMKRVILKDVTHPMKEEKLGFVRGALSRGRMYRQMLPYMLRRYRLRKRK